MTTNIRYATTIGRSRFTIASITSLPRPGQAKIVSVTVANAIRVPTPSGSLAIMNLDLKNDTSVKMVNELIRKAALEGSLVNQIKYSMNTELVSSDIIGSEGAAIFDAPATIVSENQKNVILYVWYDNEFGYTKQVIRLAKYISKVRRLHYY